MAATPKTARFAAVVEHCGHPEIYLTFLPLAKDKVLQSAIRAGRIMCLTQFDVGSRADFGKVGYDPAAARQLLLFPRPLKKFEGLKIIAINYDLLAKEKARATSAKILRPKVAKLPTPPKPTKRPIPTAKPAPLRIVEKSIPPPAKKSKPSSPEPEKPSPKHPPTLREKLVEVLAQWNHGYELRANKLLKEIVASLPREGVTK